MVMSALLHILVQKKILMPEDAKNIGNIYQLEKILEGRLSLVMDKNEKCYLDLVTKHLKAFDYGEIRKMIPPLSMNEYHELLLKTLDRFAVKETIMS